MKIYFDNTLINSDYCSELTKTGKAYDGIFKLGATICETYKMTVDKEVGNIPSTVQLKDDEDNLLKTLYVVDYNDEEDFVYKLDLEDAMTKFNFRYDASQIFVDGKTTLGAIFADICEKAGIDTDITTFYRSNMEVTWYDNTYLARDYLGYIAEINAKNFRISSNNKIEFVGINTTTSKTITFDEISDYKLGVEHTITRVVLGDWQFGTDTGETYYINEDNVYATTEATVEHIYNEINGFTYYNFKTNNCPLDGLNTGDLVTFTDGTNSYVTFAQFDNASYAGDSWLGGIEINLEGEVKQETQIVGEADRYRRIKRIVDQQNGTIVQIVEEQNEQGERMTSIEQSVSQIESQIQDIPTITTEASGTGTLHLTNLLNMRLIELKIHPTNRDILGLFASTQLKVAVGLKALSRGVTIEGDESNYYLIPDNLYFVGDVYDEFIYNGAEQKIQIIHRIGIEEGQKVVLDEPVIEEFEYRDIVVEGGDYNVFMSSYPTAYIYIKAMIKNDYTTNFATSYEVDSKITQTADEINLEVSNKVDNEDFTGANIMLKVNQDESQAQINADKVDIKANDVLNILAGNTINLTSKEISIDSTNFKVDKNGNITANNATLNSGTFKGNVNTNQNCYVGDDLYVGQNQSTAYSYVKRIYFSNVTNIGRLKIGNDEAIGLYSDFVNLNSNVGTSIGYSYNNERYNSASFSYDNFNLSCGAGNGASIGGNNFNDIFMSSQPVISSDKRLKQEIKDIDTFWIDELKVKEFEYIKSPDKKQIGLIAQDYEDKEYAKYFLNKNDDGYYSISYGNITNALIQYCQEMKKEINSLKEEIKELKESDK